MFSKDLEYSIGQCYKRAREARHEYMTVEHLLLALLDNPSAEAVLKASGTDFPRLRAELEQAIDKSVVKLDRRRRPRHPADARVPARAAARGLPRAVLRQEGSHRRQRAGGDLRREGFPRGLLPQPAGRRPGWTSSITSRTASPSRAARNRRATRKARAPKAGEGEGKGDALAEYASNLNELALAGKIDPLVGRADEVERTIQVLCRRRKNNPLYVGEAGVGKTALAEGLAKRIVDGDVPDVLADAVIYALDLTRDGLKRKTTRMLPPGCPPSLSSTGSISAPAVPRAARGHDRVGQLGQGLIGSDRAVVCRAGVVLHLFDRHDIGLGEVGDHALGQPLVLGGGVAGRQVLDVVGRHGQLLRGLRRWR